MGEMIRKIKNISKSEPTIEGAGVHLKRAFAASDPLLDPFLLLDDFHSDDPKDYVAGFPWHPHRGIETVTYVLQGKVEHMDSIGNKGVIGPGDVQWMTAGGGIIHQEMPKSSKMMQGYQLWVNLPSSRKMMEPRYRGIEKKGIPEVSISEGVTAKVISGEVGKVAGPVKDLVVDIEYLDVNMGPNKEFEHAIPKGRNAFAYVIEGGGLFDPQVKEQAEPESLVVFGAGDGVKITSGNNGLRFLFASGEPIREPVAWGGPIVMNTQEELEKAFEELDKGTFIKHK